MIIFLVLQNPFASVFPPLSFLPSPEPVGERPAKSWSSEDTADFSNFDSESTRNMPCKRFRKPHHACNLGIPTTCKKFSPSHKEGHTGCDENSFPSHHKRPGRVKNNLASNLKVANNRVQNVNFRGTSF